MVTRIYGTRPPQLYLKEHREAQHVTPAQMAGRLGISRESVHRWEREQHRLNPGKIYQYANALGIKPGRLYDPPEVPSLDDIVPPEDRQEAAEFFRLLKARRR